MGNTAERWGAASQYYNSLNDLPPTREASKSTSDGVALLLKLINLFTFLNASLQTSFMNDYNILDSVVWKVVLISHRFFLMI